jgi:hypothetical protein
VLDADTCGDLGSVLTMLTDQWADNNPGGSAAPETKQPPRKRPQSARNSSSNRGQLVVNTSAITVAEGVYSPLRRSKRPPKNALPGVQQKMQRTVNQQQSKPPPTATAL